ncbi:MAG: response regulator [Gemmatimonadota bacterium]
MNILVVEDDSVSRGALVALLASERHEAREAARGSEAVEACREALPDLIIVDYDLPDGTGLDVLREVRDACGAAPPALLVTGQSLGPRARARVAAAGARVLRKPISPQDLLAHVRAAPLGASLA